VTVLADNPVRRFSTPCLAIFRYSVIRDQCRFCAALLLFQSVASNARSRRSHSSAVISRVTLQPPAEGLGEVDNSDAATGTVDERRLEEILELANVPRPSVFAQ
jgi:hypothetical protein